MHARRHWYAVERDGNRHAVGGKSVQEVGGAVERIDDRDETVIDRTIGAELLPDKPNCRNTLGQHASDAFLRADIHAAHEIGRALLFPDDLVTQSRPLGDVACGNRCRIDCAVTPFPVLPDVVGHVHP